MAKRFNADAVDTSKKDTGVNDGALYDETEKGKGRKQQQTDPSPQEKADRENSLRTQGRRGCKGPRVCLQCTPVNLDYIKTMAAGQHLSISQFINSVIDADREKNQNAYQAVKAALDLVKK